MQGIHAISISLKEFFQLIQQTDASGCIVAEHLADHVSSIYTVFIAHIRAGQITVALLKTKYIAVSLALLLQLADLLSNEFESSQHVNSTKTIMGCDLLSHIHGHDGLHHHRICRHLAMFLTLAANIIQ